MGNCSVKAVADAANGMESIHIITPSVHSHGGQVKAPKLIIPAAADHHYFENSFRPLKTEIAASHRNYAAAYRKSVAVLPTPRNGVWKVKLVVDPRDLEEILSEQVNAEALIQKMRIAATCSNPRRSSAKGCGVGNGPHLPYMCSYRS